MTVATQPAALPIQLDPAAVLLGGMPAADMFSGIVAALATAGLPSAEQLGKGVEPATVAVEGAMAPPAETEPAAAADQLLALTCAMPAQLQLLVRKPAAPAGDETAPDNSEPDADPEQPTETNTPIAIALPVAPPPVLPAQVAATPAPRAAAEPAVQLALPRDTRIQTTVEPDELDPGPAPAKPIAPEIARLLQASMPEPLRHALGVVMAQAAPSGAAVTREKAEPAPLAPEIRGAAGLFTPLPIAPGEVAPRAEFALEPALPVEPDTGELIIERQLDLASGDEWLDDLARDIARTTSDGAPLRFRLNPEHLGSLRVEIAADRGGTAVRLTADTEAARAIIADAQPRLLAEARAQGLRISEAHVDLGHQPGSGDGRRSGEAQPEPQIRTARHLHEQEESDGKPTARGSERYA